MSRIRTVKPEFWVSEQVITCSPHARLLFIGLWNFCDDQGIHPVGYIKLKAEIFPADNFTIEQIEKWVSELITANLLREYVIEEQAYWIVTGWKHQKIDRPHPKYPPPESELKRIIDCTPSQSRTLTDHSSNEHRNLDEPSPSEGKGREGSLMEIDKCEVDTSPCSPEVFEIFEYWRRIMKHPKARMDAKRVKRIEIAFKLGYKVEELKQAIIGCSLTPFNMGQNDRGQRYDSLDLILRDADHVDGFIANAERPPVTVDDDHNTDLEWI